MSSFLLSLSVFALALVCLQLGLGAVSAFPALIPFNVSKVWIAVVSAHVGIGALILAASLLITLCSSVPSLNKFFEGTTPSLGFLRKGAVSLFDRVSTKFLKSFGYMSEEPFKQDFEEAKHPILFDSSLSEARIRRTVLRESVPSETHES